jgi:hypothetical protein
MIDIHPHHLARIVRLADARQRPPETIVAAMLMDLGSAPSPGQIAAWLWSECVKTGIERPSNFHDRAQSVAAWQALEAAWRDSEAAIEIAELD